MIELLGGKPIVLEVVVALVEGDVLALGEDVDVAVFGTDGAVALVDGLVLETTGDDFVLDGPAVAAGFVWDLLRRRCCFGHGSTELFVKFEEQY